MKIWANTIVHNEENFIWYAVMGIVDYVDRVLIWDTGSTDKTVEIIKEIKKEKGGKIDFKEVGLVDKYEFTKMRQAMLDESRSDWILILDGDEVWWKDSIKKVVSMIKKKKEEIDAIVTPFYTAVGDIYHYQPKDAGRYHLLGRKGHLTIKAIRNIPGLCVRGPYGAEGYSDGQNIPIQNKDKKIIFLDAPFLHLTHLKRSKDNSHGKYKYEWGIPFGKDFSYPEVFYQERPMKVPSPWRKISGLEKLMAQIVTPLRKIKRKLR